MNRVLFRNISIVGAAWGEFLRHEPSALAETHAALVKHVRAGLRPVVKARYRWPRRPRPSSTSRRPGARKGRSRPELTVFLVTCPLPVRKMWLPQVVAAWCR